MPDLVTRLKCALLVLAMCMAHLCCSEASADDGASWNPVHSWVFIVGVLSWPAAARLGSFSTDNRRDVALRDYFLKAGVPADHVIYLADKKATLGRINTELAQLLQRTAPGDFLFTFYCGHGWLEDDGTAYLANYDCDDDSDHNWAVDKFTRQIVDGFHGDCALLTADCCHSGKIGEKMRSLRVPFKYTTVTSVVGSESSTGNWTFAQALLDCLRGHGFADFNHNGLISIDELIRYVHDEMKHLEAQSASSVMSAEFDRNFVVSRVLFPDESAPERVEVKYEGDWWPAKVLKRSGSKVKVHWTQIGYDSASNDEWVDAATVRVIAATKVQASKAASTYNGSRQFPVGARVIVDWKGDEYEAVIKAFKDGKYYVHYDGYENSDDEWVEPSAVHK